MRAYIFLLCITFFGFSCKTINPVGPSLPSTQLPVTSLPISVIKAPVAVSLQRAFQDLDGSLQRNFGDERQVNGSLKYSWYINRNPISPSLNADGSLDLTNTARWGVEAKAKNPINGQWFHLAGCDANASISFRGVFSLNNDYSLAGNVIKRNFALDPCRVTALNFDVSSIALGIANPLIDRNLQTFNERINQYNFKDKFAEIWKAMFKTVKISDIGYLAINPESIGLGNFYGSGQTITFEVGLMAKPVISLADLPSPTIPSIPNLSSIQGSGFHINSDLVLVYSELNEIIRKEVKGKKIQYSPKGYVSLKDIELSGQNNEHLIIKLNFKAKYGWVTYKGNLFLTCLPKIDTQTQTLYLSELNFDAGTEQRLRDRGAAWILSSALNVFLGSEVKVPLHDKLTSLQAKITAGLNRQIEDHTRLSGAVKTLSIQGLFCGSDYIQVRAQASGSLEVFVDLR